jgi:hypothetical protein
VQDTVEEGKHDPRVDVGVVVGSREGKEGGGTGFVVMLGLLQPRPGSSSHRFCGCWAVVVVPLVTANGALLSLKRQIQRAFYVGARSKASGH